MQATEAAQPGAIPLVVPRASIDFVDAPIRAFALITVFWGVVGFLMGPSPRAWPW